MAVPVTVINGLLGSRVVTLIEKVCALFFVNVAAKNVEDRVRRRTAGLDDGERHG